MKRIPIESLYAALDSIEKNVVKGERRYRMILIKLTEARRNLWHRCKELFADEKIAEQIYRYLCEGLDECEDKEIKEVRRGKWINPEDLTCYKCSVCGKYATQEYGLNGPMFWKYCPNCGARMDGGTQDVDL